MHSKKKKRHKQAMTCRQLRTLFAAADRQLPIDETYKLTTLQLLHQEMSSGENQTLQDRKLLLFQLIRYADRNLSGLHLLSCIALPLLLFMVSRWHIQAESMLLLSMLLPVFLACLSAFEIRQICFVRMAELTKTCFFHVSQLAALSMILSGIMNLMAVTAGILLLGFQWQKQLLAVGLYILVPYIFMQCVCFGTMLTRTGQKYLWLNAVPAILLALCLTILLQKPMLYTESALFFWAVALLAGIIICIAEIRLFFAKLRKGDILCTDWS